MRLFGGQPVELGNAGALQARSLLYTTPLAPVWGGGPLVPGNVPGRESFLGPAPTNRYNMGSTDLISGGNFMGGAGSAINPEKFKKDARQQKIYNKGMGTDNINEKEMFLKRTGPQLPLAQGFGNSFGGIGNVGNVGGLLAQASPSSEATLFQEYAGALLNPFGFLEKTKNTVNKLNERTRKQEEMIQELLGK